ncbi:hypothetical protein M404DRAFT_113236, partial [Pisolithus tinctorius Marx 270]
DNGGPYILALDWLSKTFRICHIRISPYNSQANGVVEHQHFNVREALVKSCRGEASKWSEVAPVVFWAERVTVHKATGFSPFYMAHGVEPRLPFDIVEATFLAPFEPSSSYYTATWTFPTAEFYSTSELIPHHAHQLQKHPEDLAQIHDLILRSCFMSVKDFITRFAHTIQDFNFEPGSLILVRNSRIERELDHKTKPCYLGPMIVVQHTKGGLYILAELDGAVSKFHFGAYCLYPYFLRNDSRIKVTQLTGISAGDLDHLE